MGEGEDVLSPLHLPGISPISPLHLPQVKTCFSNEGQPPDPACPAGFSRTYIGTNCAGTEAWQAEHGNKACDCTDGVCKNCCKEECFDDNTHTCSWRDANLGRIYVVDDACPDGYSRCQLASRLYLPYISPTARLHLACISPIAPARPPRQVLPGGQLRGHAVVGV